MKDKIEQSRKAGYSDDQIVEFLSQQPQYSDKIQKSVEAGYKPKDIISFLSKNERKLSPHTGEPEEEGFIGGKVGRAASTASQHPSQVLKETPVAAIQGAENIAGLTQLPQNITRLIAEKISGQDLGSENQLPRASEMAAKKVREGLPENQLQGAQDIADIEEFIMPFVQGMVQKLLSKGGAASGAVPKTPSATRTRQQGIQELYKQRSAMSITPNNTAPKIGKAEALAKGIIPEDLQISPYEAAEEALKQITPSVQTQQAQKQIAISEAPARAPKSLAGRVSNTEEALEKGGKPLGVQVKIEQPSKGKELKGLVKAEEGPGTSISPMEFESEASAGTGTSNAIKEAASAERKEVSELYKVAEEDYKNINSIADEQLVQELREESKKIRQSLKPNTAESSVLKTVDDLLESYITRNGVSVRQLIKSSDSLSGMANYELPFTGPKDILKKVANSLDQAAMRAIENNGGNSQFLKNANAAYGKWANRFANDEISPFLERTIRAPEQLARRTISDEGVFRAVEDSLQNTKNAKAYSDAFARKIAEKRMGHYGDKDLSKVGTAKYEQELRDLKALIGEKRANSFDNFLKNKEKMSFGRYAKGEIARERKGAKIRPERVTSATKKVSIPSKVVTQAPKVKIGPQQTTLSEGKLNKLIKKIGETKDLTPEDVHKMFNSRSGIKKLKAELPEKNFDVLANQKVRSILQKGQVEGKFTGQDLYEILNKESNAEILSEILGKEAVSAIREEARLIGKGEITLEKAGKFMKKLIGLGVSAKAAKVMISGIAALL